MDITAIGSLLERARRRAGLSQRELADRAGTSQPAIARLEQGRASPTFATLERLAAAAGFALRVELVPRPPSDPVVEAYKRDVDRTLLRANLEKSVDERIRSLAELQAFGTEVERAVREAKRRR
jgi:transcriptional regulator with XRE-family HTH domain